MSEIEMRDYDISDATSNTDTTLSDAPPLESQPQYDYPPGLVICILEQLYLLAPNQILHLRRLSKFFSYALQPLIYRKINLTSKVLESFSERASDLHASAYGAKRCICAYTEHVTVDRDVHWKLAEHAIGSMRRLRSLTWSYWGLKLDRDSKFFNSGALKVIEVFEKKFPKAELHIQNLSPLSLSFAQFYSLPFHRITSCTIAPSGAELGRENWALNLRDLLTKHRESGTFCVNVNNCIDNGYRKTEETDVNTLPLRSLKLLNVEWPRYASTVWNWSTLTSLELQLDDFTIFSREAPYLRLNQLKHLALEGTIRHDVWKRLERAICGILVRIEALTSLHLWFRSASSTEKIIFDNKIMTSIMQSGPLLRSLCLKDDSYGVSPRNKALIALSTNSPRLMDFNADIDWSSITGKKDTNYLSTFRNLRRLILYTNVTHNTSSGKLSEYLARYIVLCEKWIRNLVSAKEGAPFEKISLYIHIRSKSSTKNPITEDNATTLAKAKSKPKWYGPDAPLGTQHAAITFSQTSNGAGDIEVVADFEARLEESLASCCCPKGGRAQRRAGMLPLDTERLPPRVIRESRSFHSCALPMRVDIQEMIGREAFLNLRNLQRY